MWSKIRGSEYSATAIVIVCCFHVVLLIRLNLDYLFQGAFCIGTLTDGNLVGKCNFMRQSFLLAIRLTFTFLLYLITVFVEPLILMLEHTTECTLINLTGLHLLHLILHADLVHVVIHVPTLNKTGTTFS